MPQDNEQVNVSSFHNRSDQLVVKNDSNNQKQPPKQGKSTHI